MEEENIKKLKKQEYNRRYREKQKKAKQEDSHISDLDEDIILSDSSSCVSLKKTYIKPPVITITATPEEITKTEDITKSPEKVAEVVPDVVKPVVKEEEELKEESDNEDVEISQEDLENFIKSQVETRVKEQMDAFFLQQKQIQKNIPQEVQPIQQVEKKSYLKEISGAIAITLVPELVRFVLKTIQTPQAGPKSLPRMQPVPNQQQPTNMQPQPMSGYEFQPIQFATFS